MLWKELLVPEWVMRVLGPVQAAVALVGGWLGMVLLLVDALQADGGARLWPLAALALLAPAVAAVTAVLGSHYWFQFEGWYTMWRYWESDSQHFAAILSRAPSGSGSGSPAQAASTDSASGAEDRPAS